MGAATGAAEAGASSAPAAAERVPQTRQSGEEGGGASALLVLLSLLPFPFGCHFFLHVLVQIRESNRVCL